MVYPTSPFPYHYVKKRKKERDFCDVIERKHKLGEASFQLILTLRARIFFQNRAPEEMA